MVFHFVSYKYLYCSDFWVFNTPIYPNWIPKEDVRINLEKGAVGENKVDDSILNVLQKNIDGIENGGF